MNYIVQEVGDDELPEGRNVVIVEREEGPPVMLINGAPARVWRLMRAWEDMHEPCTVPSHLLPAPARRGLAELQPLPHPLHRVEQGRPPAGAVAQ